MWDRHLGRFKQGIEPVPTTSLLTISLLTISLWQNGHHSHCGVDALPPG